jgi:CzcA family heavy metal efflux pump
VFAPQENLIMMDRLIHWALANRTLVLAAAALLLVFGGWTATRLPVDVFPDLTAPTVTVVTEAHGMAPTEVESQVTFPIEAALNGAAGVRRVRSSTAVGISIVWVEFEWGTDIYNARQMVSEKLMLVGGELPPEVARPVLAPITSIMGEVMFVALASDRHLPLELRTAADTVVRRRLLAVPGVSQVTTIGGGRKQFQVRLSPDRLLAHGLSVQQVANALAAGNENVSAGFLNERGSEWLITGLGRVRTLDDIRETPVVVREGVPVTIGDVAEVVIGEAPKRGEGAANGQRAVVIGIQKQPEANTLALTGELDRVLDALAADLPAGMTIQRDLFRQADFIEVAVRNVEHALRDGAILVVLVIVVFLANKRASLITLTAIPLSLVAAALALKFFGLGINTMTLGGLAIAMGALVDDAVIDVENVFRRLRENATLPAPEQRPPLRIVLEASIEIRSSIVFATLIIALVFVPVFFLSGVEGRLLAPLGLAYLVALFASLIVAVTVTPVLCHLLLPRSRAVRQGTEPRFARWLKSQFERVLRPALRHPWAVTLPGVALLIGALAALPFMGRSFLPEFNEGSLTIAAVSLPGTSLDESEALARLVEEALLKQPEVVAVGRRTGRAEQDEHAMGVESSEMEVSLRMQKRSKEQLLEAIRAEFAAIPGLNLSIGQPISHRIDHMLSGTRASVAVKIFGDNLHTLRSLAARTQAAMAAVPGVVDLFVEQQVDVPTLTVRFDRAAMGRHGLHVADAAKVLEAAVQGLAVSRVLEGQNAFDLVVRLDDPQAARTDTLGELLVDTPSGARVPLQSFARLVKDLAPNTVSRENAERKIVVSCNVAGRDLASVVEDCRQAVAPVIAGQPGYRVEFGGQFESATQARRVLLAVGAAVVLGIGLLLHMAFGSVRDTLLVMLNLPLALIGGVAGVFLSGGVLSVASLIGFITVFGIATRNGIMLVSHIRHLQLAEGVTDLAQAVHRGAMERLVPVLMTALATGLALIPLALGGGRPGSEIQTPMAIVILSGLLTSMILNMLVVPALYLRFGRPAQPSEGEAP